MVDFLVVEDEKSTLRTLVDFIGTVEPSASVSTAEDYESAVAQLDEATGRNRFYTGIVVDGYFPRQKNVEAEELWYELAQEILRRGYSHEAIIVYTTNDGILKKVRQQDFTAISKTLVDLEKHLKILVIQAEQAQRK